MRKLKFRFFIVVIFFTKNIAYPQYTDQINTNRPSYSMGAFSTGKGITQGEFGVDGIYENHSIKNSTVTGTETDFGIRHGVWREQFEIILDMKYQNGVYSQYGFLADKKGMKQTTLGAKYLLYDPFKNYVKKLSLYSWKANHRYNWRQWLPAVSFYVGTNMFSKNNIFYYDSQFGISPKVTLITQNIFEGGRWVLVTNISADYLFTEFMSYNYVATLTHGLNDRWSVFFENQGILGDFYSDVIVRGGAVFLATQDLQIDAAITINFKTTPFILYGGIGVSWRWDAKHRKN